MRSYKAWRRRRILDKIRFSEAIWREAESRLPLLCALTDAERLRLRELAALFLHEKTFEPAGGVELTDTLRLTVALQACLPILNLGLDWYRGWRAVIVYPGEFIPDHEEIDEAGVVHASRHPLSGESWQSGPVILSLPDIAGSGDGGNLIIHEFAHKLDMLNGTANGMPPLHPGMRIEAWSEAFSQAFDDFRQRMHDGDETGIDPYAAEAPEEFFAVLSEVFFEAPRVLERIYPAVYEQLRLFYRQDPAARQQ